MYVFRFVTNFTNIIMAIVVQDLVFKQFEEISQYLTIYSVLNILLQSRFKIGIQNPLSKRYRNPCDYIKTLYQQRALNIIKSKNSTVSKFPHVGCYTLYKHSQKILVPTITIYTDCSPRYWIIKKLPVSKVTCATFIFRLAVKRFKRRYRVDANSSYRPFRARYLRCG